jgi:hypothetical protein
LGELSIGSTVVGMVVAIIISLVGFLAGPSKGAMGALMFSVPTGVTTILLAVEHDWNRCFSLFSCIVAAGITASFAAKGQTLKDKDGPCSPDQPLSPRPDQAAAQIQSWVPIGTSLVEARRIMGQHQFTCAVMKNSRFADLKDIDFLYCDRHSPGGTLLVRRWQVALILSNDQISEVRVTSDLVGTSKA